MTAPAAERNLPALCDLLHRLAPTHGKALELASGTGQHIVAFAARHLALQWQPTEPDPLRRDSIDAWVAATGVSNVAPALFLDATRPGWADRHADQALILLVNLLHLISQPETETLIHEAARALAPGGVFLLYGPFRRAHELTSDADRAFDASLRAQDPEIGYKNDIDVLAMLTSAGLHAAPAIDMPANNLALTARKPA